MVKVLYNYLLFCEFSVISIRIHTISNVVCGQKCHYGTKLVTVIRWV